MRFLFLILVLVLPVSSFAQENGFYARPWMAKVKVGRLLNGNTCADDARNAYGKLAREHESVLFGWPEPRFFSNGLGCYGTILFASKKPIDHGVYRKIFAEVNLPVSYIVDTNSGTFMGFMAVINYKDGTYDYCERKEERLIPFASWIEGYTKLSSEVLSIWSADLETKLNWLTRNFSCRSIGEAQSVDVVMDLANKEICPFNAETDRTCFINRGFYKYNLVLQ